MKFFALILTIALGVGVFSKPDEQALKDYFYDQTLTNLKDVGINKDDNLLTGALKLACMFSVETCAEAVVEGLKFETKDYFVLKLSKVSINDDAYQCVGLYKTWKCF